MAAEEHVKDRATAAADREAAHCFCMEAVKVTEVVHHHGRGRVYNV